MQLSTFCTLITTLFFLSCSSGNSVTINNTLELPLTANTTSSITSINPEHYPVQGTPLVLTAVKPYGPKLPDHAALVCLAGAVVDLAKKIIEEGRDHPLPNGYIFVASHVRVYIQVVQASHFLLRLAKAALEGVEALMEESGGTGERSIKVLVNHVKFGWIGRIVVSSVESGNGPPIPEIEATSAASGVTPTSSSVVVAGRAAPSPNIALINVTSTHNTVNRLTPDHYRIPGTEVYVVIFRPYGRELPHAPTIKLILDAAYSVQHDRAAQGDVQLPMDWRFEGSGLFVSFNSRDFNRPLLSTMQAGLIGLFDLMDEESVVGTKEILFGMGIEDQGDCGSGQINWIDPLNDNVTVGAARSAARRPLGMSALQTDVSATS
ncbi:hypothetical protein N7G274_009006 [Stereocaulon virgatum]|uniref:Uncharacterized protein n=1 Tax=Stereocaulon virgatum TaxID=373712 RepID=A0ABR4A1X5_9LECA